MISKSSFVSIMEEVQKLESYQDSIDSIFCLNDWPISNMCGHIAEEIAKLCGDIKEEDEYGPLIFDYMYTYDFGTHYDEDEYLIQCNGKKYKPESWSELYDVYVELQK